MGSNVILDVVIWYFLNTRLKSCAKHISKFSQWNHPRCTSNWSTQDPWSCGFVKIYWSQNHPSRGLWAATVQPNNWQPELQRENKTKHHDWADATQCTFRFSFSLRVGDFRIHSTFNITHQILVFVNHYQDIFYCFVFYVIRSR